MSSQSFVLPRSVAICRRAGCDEIVVVRHDHELVSVVFQHGPEHALIIEDWIMVAPTLVGNRLAVWLAELHYAAQQKERASRDNGPCC